MSRVELEKKARDCSSYCCRFFNFLRERGETPTKRGEEKGGEVWCGGGVEFVLSVWRKEGCLLVFNTLKMA